MTPPMNPHHKPQEDVVVTQGTFACPICGEEKPHHHTAPVANAYHTKGSRK